MAISTTAFGVYFYLMSKLHSTTSLSLLMLDMQSTSAEEPHPDLAWLALASMAVFIMGEIFKFVIETTIRSINTFICKCSDQNESKGNANSCVSQMKE